MTQKELDLKSIMDKLIWRQMKEREAAKSAKKSLRQIQRIKKRYILYGDIWLIHKSRWRPSNNQSDGTKYDQAVQIIQSHYHDYSYIMMHEKLAEKHSIFVSAETLRNALIRRGIRFAKKQKIPDTQRCMRERKENYGEMVQYDGSYHLWFENRAEEACLLVSVDDATGEVTAQFDTNEGICATYRFWMEFIREKWKPQSIYIDKFSTYKVNHPNATDDKELATQFGRVCKELGIELIFANSPQGKWRVERMNGTLQDRLVKELREANISTIPEANVFLKETFLPKFNAQFRVEPRWKSNLHIPLREDEKEQLDQIFSQKKERKVQNDYTIRFENKIIQLYRDKQWGSLVYKWERVIVEKHINGKLLVSNKNKKYILSKEITEMQITRKNCSLPLPPTIGENEQILKDEIIKQTEQKEEQEKQQKIQAAWKANMKTYFEKHGTYHPYSRTFSRKRMLEQIIEKKQQKKEELSFAK